MSRLVVDGSVVLTPADAMQIAGLLALAGTVLDEVGFRADCRNALMLIGHAGRGEPVHESFSRVIARRLEQADAPDQPTRLGADDGKHYVIDPQDPRKLLPREAAEPTIPTMGDAIADNVAEPQPARFATPDHDGYLEFRAGAFHMVIQPSGEVFLQGKPVGEAKDILEGFREFLLRAHSQRAQADAEVRTLIRQARHAHAALTTDVNEQTRQIVGGHLAEALAPFPNPLPIDWVPS